MPGLVLESGSFDALIERVRFTVPELLELNGTAPAPRQLRMVSERCERVDEDGIKAALIHIPQQLLVGFPAGRLGAFTADCFICVHLQDDQEYVVNELEAGYVRKIFDAAANREGFTAIIEELAAAGITFSFFSRLTCSPRLRATWSYLWMRMVSKRPLFTSRNSFCPISGRYFTVDGKIKSRHTANAIMKQSGIDHRFR